MYSNTTDGSTDNEAVKIANAFKPFWKKWMKEWGRNCVRSKKMTVTTAPSMSTGLIGVTDAFSDTECMIPFQNNVANANVGDTVWVKWMYDNQQTMYAENMGDIRSEKVILSGVKNAEPVPSGGSVSYSISFEKPFKETPVVVASMISPHSVETGLCSVRILDISPFAFTVGYQNGSQYSRNIGASWIATGELLNNPIQYITDTTPYLNRAIPYSSNYLNLNKVVGGTVAWNQFAPSVESGNYSLAANATKTLTFSNGVATIHADAAAGTQIYFLIDSRKRKKSVIGHKYLFVGTVQTQNGVLAFLPTGTTSHGLLNYAQYSTKSILSYIWSAGVEANISAAFKGYTGGASISSAIDFTVEKVNAFDLTLLLGSTIADYVYTLESGTAGAGIAWLKKYGWFTKPYYPYKAAALESVKTSAHKTIGFNQCNESIHSGHYWANGVLGTSYGVNYAAIDTMVKVVPNTSYCVFVPDATNGSSLTCYLNQFDANGAFISNKAATLGDDKYHVFTTDANVGYITVSFYRSGGATTGERICISLHWDGERDGEYEPYEAHTYALDGTKEWRGIFRLDANNNLYADGDIYPPSGEAQRRYGIVDLGTLNWQGSDGGFSTVADASLNMKVDVKNAVCEKYIFNGNANNTSASSILNALADKEMASYQNDAQANRFVVKDSAYTDAATFKAAMSGVYLVYELATPTTESADEYARLQKCDPNGTEQFIDERTVQIPVGHETEYIIL